MIELKIDEKNEGGRFDKFLKRHLKAAQSDFIYKMLRKKNITLNDRKAEGKEILKKGDVVKIFFSDDTYRKFTNVERGRSALNNMPKVKPVNARQIFRFEERIIYEDDALLLFNKPSGMLSQRDSGNIRSANEYFLEYLMAKEDRRDILKDFNPSACNRLDRNTSGILIFAKNYSAAREISKGLRERTIEKYYLALVKGKAKSKRVSAYIKKDESANKVEISETFIEGYYPILTEYTVEKYRGDYTLLRIELLTGKPHQIRAQLSYDGFPILGDPKYGDPRLNRVLKEQYGIAGQLLHAHEIRMPAFEGVLKGVSGKTFIAEPPETFNRVIEGA